MQLVGRPFEEGTLLQVARTWERRDESALRVPPVVEGGA
jgi:Asp-tRNA(Asn)/Glu-tRNA(Gln) amidotransferase A subunit family amidase